jgi:hypothetical protein
LFPFCAVVWHGNSNRNWIAEESANHFSVMCLFAADDPEEMKWGVIAEVSFYHD